MKIIIRKLFTFLKIIQSSFYKKYLSFFKEIFVEDGVFFNRLPSISIAKNTKLQLGKNVIINSCNSGYHLNMHSKCKFLLDRPGAQVIVGNNTRIHGTCVHAYKKIVIGKNCLIAANTQIFDGSGHDLSLDNPENRINTVGSSNEIIIGDNVWIGANCIVLPGSVIGQGSVISANSVVRGSIPEKCLAAGNPIRIIKTEEK